MTPILYTNKNLALINIKIFKKKRVKMLDVSVPIKVEEN
jgi:hypothetical protein